MNPEELLAHADFIRGLARTLVRDEHGAADLTQQTCVAALEQPAGTIKSPRGWLTIVIRNLRNRWYRTDSRREVRERIVSAPEGIPSTEDVVEREEIRDKVVDAVLSLEDPYRSAVLLRFYEDLSMREVAERMGINYSTARSQTNRGIEMLRKKLDDAFGGDRQAWCLALLPIAGLKAVKTAASGTAPSESASSESATTGTASSESTTATTTSGAATTAATGSGLAGGFTGFLLSSIKFKIAAIALIATITCAGLWIFLPEASQTDGWTNPLSTQSETAMQNAPEEHHAGGSTQNNNIAATITQSEETTKEVIESSAMFVAGTVTDKITGEPVKDYFISGDMVYDRGGNFSVIQERIQDEEGRFHCPLPESGILTMHIMSAAHRQFKMDDIVIEKDKGNSGMKIEIDPGGVVIGRVVDDETDRPVKCAVIGTSDGNPITGLEFLTRQDRDSSIHTCNYTYTDAKGNFRLSGLDVPRQKIMAVHDDYVIGFVHALPGDEQAHEIRLSKGFRIYGKTYGDDGELAEGVEVELNDPDNRMRRYVLSGAGGHYKTAPAPPGEVHLKARPSVKTAGKFSSESREVVLVDRDVEVDFGPSSETASWYGTLYDYNNEPISKALLSLDPYLAGQGDNGRPRTASHARTDKNGCFKLHKLSEPEYEVTVSIHTLDSNCKVDAGTVHLGDSQIFKKDIHLSGGVIEGTLHDGNTRLPITTGGMLSAYSGSLYRKPDGHCSIGNDGKFILRNLPEGVTRIFFYEDIGPNCPVTEIELSRGETILDHNLFLPERGKLDLRVADLHPNALQIKLQHENDENVRAPLDRIQKEDEYKISYDLKTGSWLLFVTHQELGSLTCSFNIAKAESSLVRISRSDFESNATYEEKITLEGSVTGLDGNPAKGMVLYLQNFSHTSQGPDDNRTCRTDAFGNFHAENMKPGQWMLYVITDECTRLFLPSLVVPEDAVSPMKVEIPIPTGRIQGRFVDATTGETIGNESPVERFSVMGKDGYTCHIQLWNSPHISSFDLGGLPAGEFRVEAALQGYGEYRSDVFRAEEGQHIDMGDILLEPCGRLIVEVKDPSGNPIQSFDVELFLPDGTTEFRRPMWLNGSLAAGKNQYGSIPFGKTRMRISSTNKRAPNGVMQRDYHAQEIDIDCRPGEPVEVRITLEPKQ